jgi:hypothetical protein
MPEPPWRYRDSPGKRIRTFDNQYSSDPFLKASDGYEMRTRDLSFPRLGDLAFPGLAS